MALWAANKDKEDKRKQDYQRLPAIKRKRATEKIAKMKDEMLQEKKAKTSGLTYATGIANRLDNPSNISTDDVDNTGTCGSTTGSQFYLTRVSGDL